jgi:hypothetical protein
METKSTLYMNLKITASLAATAAAFLLAGCNTTPEPPVTYQIPIGYSPQVTSVFGVENLNVSATHDLDVKPGVPMYFQVASPVSMTVYVFDKTGSGPGGVLLRQLQGTNIISSATATSHTLQFVFSAAAYTGGTVQFTVSDRPLGPPTAAMDTTLIQSTTTSTTVTPAPAPQPPPSKTTTTTVVTSTAPTPPAN